MLLDAAMLSIRFTTLFASTCLVLGTFTKGEPISGCGGWHGETPFRQLDQLELLEVGLNLEIP